ncbi:unnamed protein product [Ilex paraguariensis]|uniref:Transcription factor GAMYB n=1 Tax=Ilex paraguariensis TaxID=185542 RepID=A0ABC8U4P9_9AQUA
MSITSGSDDKIMSMGCIDSPSAASSGGNVTGSGPLKKGPWTSAEDAILAAYVNKHGEGNWNAVQKHSGLSRCGKSCRLRWANHLRPDLKKGAFTPEEEHHIIELHAKMGNKWARMAAELPGRTDNEIKNYWNTRIKRRQRAGLSIYPPDICLQALNEDQQSQNVSTFSYEDRPSPDLLLSNHFEIPSVEFKNLELNQQLYPQSLLDVSGNSLLVHSPGSFHSNNSSFAMMHPAKRLRESESLHTGLSGSLGDLFPAFNQYQDDACEKLAHSLGFSCAYDHNIHANHPSTSCLLPGSHALLNGNSSSSEPFSWAMKLELPSLQYSDTQVGSCGSPSPLPSRESVDTLIWSPPTEQMQLDCLSSRNSGLLEAVLYESQTLKNSKNSSCQQTPNASLTPDNVVDTLTQNLHRTGWEVYGDPISPLGYSAASVFSVHESISRSSTNEHQSAVTVPGFKIKQEPVDWVSAWDNGKDEVQPQMIFSRPDCLLGSNCYNLNL